LLRRVQFKLSQARLIVVVIARAKPEAIWFS
jgi:hypothetical protein